MDNLDNFSLLALHFLLHEGKERNWNWFTFGGIGYQIREEAWKSLVKKIPPENLKYYKDLNPNEPSN